MMYDHEEPSTSSLPEYETYQYQYQSSEDLWKAILDYPSYAVPSTPAESEVSDTSSEITLFDPYASSAAKEASTPDESTPPHQQQEPEQISDEELWTIIRMAERHFPPREHIVSSLTEIQDAFMRHFTERDGFKYMDNLARLETFFDENTDSNFLFQEQEKVIQILQLARVIHHTEINNPILSEADRSPYHLASISIDIVIRKALPTITYTDFAGSANTLSTFAKQAVELAIIKLDISKYLDFDLYTTEESFDTFDNVASCEPKQTTPRPTMPLPRRSRLSVTKSVSQEATYSCRSSQPAQEFVARGKARQILSGHVSGAGPLLRTQSLPVFSSSTSYSSLTPRQPLRAYPLGNSLQSVPEMCE